MASTEDGERLLGRRGTYTIVVPLNLVGITERTLLKREMVLSVKGGF